MSDSSKQFPSGPQKKPTPQPTNSKPINLQPTMARKLPGLRGIEIRAGEELPPYNTFLRADGIILKDNKFNKETK